MKKLYYVIGVEMDFVNETEGSITGNRTIYVYDIVDNVYTSFATIHCETEDDSEEMIQDYLNDNGYGDDEFEFILL
jgi:hypothetical protein